MANIECTIANHGYYYKPHLIKSIGDKQVIKTEYTKPISVGIDTQYFEPVIDGMQRVVESGTAAAARIPGIVMCGKTGTAQNSHGKNNSIFVAFAPRDHPRIAIAVVVENAGYGATYAAPIASYIVEKYLRGNITKPQGEVDYIINQNLLPDSNEYRPKRPRAKTNSPKQKVDTARSKNDVKTASRKNKRNNNVAYLAAQPMLKDDE
jgi:penicillin-binding protein 2